MTTDWSKFSEIFKPEKSIWTEREGEPVDEAAILAFVRETEPQHAAYIRRVFQDD